ALVLVKLDARKAAFVVDRDGRAILDRAADVINVDVVAEDGRSADVLLLNRRPGEAYERGIRQRVAQVLREAVGDVAGLALDPRLEAVLAAVRLIGDDDDVAPVRQQRVNGRPAFGRELLERGEDNAAGGPV